MLKNKGQFATEKMSSQVSAHNGLSETIDSASSLKAKQRTAGQPFHRSTQHPNIMGGCIQFDLYATFVGRHCLGSPFIR
jgi:hypothetical protein